MSETESDAAKAGKAMAEGKDPQIPEESTDGQSADAENTPQIATQLEGIRTELSAFNSKLDNLLYVMEGLRALNQGHNKNPGQDNTETDTTVTQEHEYNESELEETAYNWIQEFSQFNSNLFADVPEVEFCEVDGQLGLKFEAGKPWNSECHNGNEWTDKDRWDTHREAFKQLMQGQDQVEYHGEPDYFNFLPADSVSEVVE